MQILITWKGKDWYLYHDGIFMERKQKVTTEVNTGIDDLFVGASSGGTSFLNGYIKALQISTDFLPPKKNRTRIALYGDSFVQTANARTDAAADTVAGYDAVQHNLTLEGTGTKDRQAYLIGNPRNQNNWFWCLSRWFWLEYGETLLCYNAAKSGYGWTTRTGVNQFTQAQRDAIIAYDPEVIIALGSVNDVNPSADLTDANCLNQIQAQLDDFIDGCPSLRKILFFGGFTAASVPAKIAVNNWGTDFKNYYDNAAQIANYRGIVEYIDTWEDWGGAAPPVNYMNGSHPDNLSSTGPTQLGNDGHPSAEGHIKIAEIMWPYIKSFLAKRAIL